jgi:hypothetical protein
VPAYAVKHLVDERGPLSKIMKRVKQTPYSLTSKEPEATDAAAGSFVYVIEVRVQGGLRTYWLGYRYRAFEKVRPAGGGLWEGKYKFKNSAQFAEPATGSYFDAPVRIEDSAFCEWLAAKQPGMAEIPPDLLLAVDAQFSNPANEARAFA